MFLLLISLTYAATTSITDWDECDSCSDGKYICEGSSAEIATEWYPHGIYCCDDDLGTDPTCGTRCGEFVLGDPTGLRACSWFDDCGAEIEFDASAGAGQSHTINEYLEGRCYSYVRVLNADGPVQFSIIDDSGSPIFSVSAFSYTSSSDTATILDRVSTEETLTGEFDPTSG